MDSIRLKEFEEQEVNLSIDEVLIVKKNCSNVLEIWPSIKSNFYFLKAKSIVGVIILPTGRRIFIEPKVPVEIIFTLLARVYDPRKEIFKEQTQEYETINALFEFVVSFFISLTEDLISRGLLRGYQDRIEDSQAIRGRVLVEDTIINHPGLFDRHLCLSRRFTPDISENRIILWTTLVLRTWNYIEKNLPVRLHRIQHAMSRVQFDINARELLENLTFHRLNTSYKPALQVARLILDFLSFSGLAGENPFLAYLIDMNQLFEDYLSVVIEEELFRSDISVRLQKFHKLDVSRKINIKPDIILFRKDIPFLVIDAKYKIKAAQDDIYQMVAYCHGVDVKNAMLIHPKTEETFHKLIRIKGSGEFSIKYKSIDLNGEPEELEENSRALINEIVQEYGGDNSETL